MPTYFELRRIVCNLNLTFRTLKIKKKMQLVINCYCNELVTNCYCTYWKNGKSGSCKMVWTRFTKRERKHPNSGVELWSDWKAKKEEDQKLLEKKACWTLIKEIGLRKIDAPIWKKMATRWCNLKGNAVNPVTFVDGDNIRNFGCDDYICSEKKI